MDLNRLGSDEERQAVVFNLHGIVEAAKQIEELLALLDQQFGRDFKAAAKTATDLQVQVYDHLAYHLKTLRSPLSKLSNALYREVEGRARPGLDQAPRKGPRYRRSTAKKRRSSKRTS